MGKHKGALEFSCGGVSGGISISQPACPMVKMDGALIGQKACFVKKVAA
jgi:hypothetical protein